MAADDGRHSPRYPAYSQRRARNTEAPAAIAVAVSDGDHEKTKIVDFSKTYEKWMRMTMMSTFAEPGLESTYRAYQMSVFGDRVKTWFLLVALMCTCGMIIIETGHLFTGNLAIRGNIALRLQINGAAMLYWLGFFCARSVPTSWLHAFYKRQQVILCLISITFGIAVALPGLLQPNQLSSAPLDGLDRYVQGHFGAIFGATCLMTLAWSDLSPLIYAILSLFLLVVWNLRNIRMQFAALPAAGTGANGTLPSGQAHESPSFEDMYQVTLLHYLAAWVGSIFISYQKDTLMRRNFVILQFVKSEKDKRIKALRGEKDSLEVRLTDLEARATQGTQQIKFVDSNAPDKAPRDRHSFKPRVTRIRLSSRCSSSQSATSSSTSTIRNPRPETLFPATRATTRA